MRCSGAKQKHAQGSSLLEVIGVLSIVAILAAMLISTVFGAIHSATINQTASSLNSLRTACAGHYAQFSSIAADGSINPPGFIPLDGSDPRSAQFDRILMAEAFLDNLFAPKIGDRILSSTNTRVQIVAGLPSSTAPDQNNAAYNLDGNGINEATGGAVVEAIITGVSLEDARALNDLLDGPKLAENSSGNDFVGRVKYSAPGSSGGSGAPSGGSGNGNGNGNGLGNGSGNGGNNNGNGNGGHDNGNGNGGNGNGGNTGSGSTGSTQAPNTVTVHIYLTHH